MGKYLIKVDRGVAGEWFAETSEWLKQHTLPIPIGDEREKVLHLFAQAMLDYSESVYSTLNFVVSPSPRPLLRVLLDRPGNFRPSTAVGKRLGRPRTVEQEEQNCGASPRGGQGET